MSIGNLKDNGNKGNNFPWQLKVLLGQQSMVDQLIDINGNTDSVEFLLTSILTTLQDSTEYEAKFVVDTCDSDKVYLEVRVWNPDTSTWGPITYYIPGNDTPVEPVGVGTPGCLKYTDPSTLLSQILNQLIDIKSDTVNLDVALSTRATEATLLLAKGVLDNIKLDTAAIDTNTDQIESLLTAIDAVLDNIKLDTANLDVTLSTRASEVTLAALEAKFNSLGQKLSAASAPVVLSTEQEVILDAIKTAVEAINLDADSLAKEVTLQATNTLLTTIDGVLDNIKLDTANLDVALSTRATEATLAAVNAKLNSLGQKTSAGSVPVVLSSEQEAFIDGIEGLLTTIDAVLDAIKLDTAALVVDIAAIEVLQNGILSALNTIDGVLDNILLDTNAMVVDLAAIEVLITTTNSLLTTIDGVIDQIQTNTLNTVNELTTANVSLNNIYNELLAQGSGLDALVIDAAAIEAELLDQGLSLDALVTDIAAIEVELLDQGITLDAIAVDAAAIEAELLDQGLSLDALVVDLAAIEVELLDQGTTLDAILVDTGQIETELLDQGVSLDALVVDAAAIEAELLDQGLTLDSVETELQSIDNRLTTKVITPNILRVTGAGTIASAVYSFSVANVGAGNGTILGATIKPTETLSFDAGSLNNTYAAGTIAYDGTGSELLITYNS